MLVWILAGLALALVPFIVVAVNAQRKYRGLFDDDHLLELAALLAELKAAAAADGLPHSALTSHGLAVTWDATVPELSLSHRDGKLHDTAAAFLTALTERLVAAPPGTDITRLRRAGRHVLRLALPPDADAAFRAAPLLSPDRAALPPLRAAAADDLRTTRFERA